MQLYLHGVSYLGYSCEILVVQCQDRAGQAGYTCGLGRPGPQGSLPGPGLKQQAGGVLGLNRLDRLIGQVDRLDRLIGQIDRLDRRIGLIDYRFFW